MLGKECGLVLDEGGEEFDLCLLLLKLLLEKWDDGVGGGWNWCSGDYLGVWWRWTRWWLWRCIWWW